MIVAGARIWGDPRAGLVVLPDAPSASDRTEFSMALGGARVRLSGRIRVFIRVPSLRRTSAIGTIFFSQRRSGEDPRGYEPTVVGLVSTPKSGVTGTWWGRRG